MKISSTGVVEEKPEVFFGEVVKSKPVTFFMEANHADDFLSYLAKNPHVVESMAASGMKNLAFEGLYVEFQDELDRFYQDPSLSADDFWNAVSEKEKQLGIVSPYIVDPEKQAAGRKLIGGLLEKLREQGIKPHLIDEYPETLKNDPAMAERLKAYNTALYNAKGDKAAIAEVERQYAPYKKDLESFELSLVGERMISKANERAAERIDDIAKTGATGVVFGGGHTMILSKVKADYTQIDIFGRNSHDAESIANMVSDQPNFIFNVDTGRPQAFKEMLIDATASGVLGYQAHSRAEEQAIKNVQR
ncbi:MAG: hypothetical protein MRY32_02140 [Rickettsiales bacterium]|nr:hypothetical protein [Rickettsiales bacterium]